MISYFFWKRINYFVVSLIVLSFGRMLKIDVLMPHLNLRSHECEELCNSLRDEVRPFFFSTLSLKFLS
jgi:hypothetical protein